MRTILVVEDEPQIAGLVRDYLEHAGFAVLTASDGAAALATWRARRPDALVRDLGPASTASMSSAPSAATRPSPSSSSPPAATRPTGSAASSSARTTTS